jgi:hypothetical protein
VRNGKVLTGARPSARRASRRPTNGRTSASSAISAQTTNIHQTRSFQEQP